MQIIRRKDAILLGLPRYYTGKPCKRGHIAQRNISGSCSACANIAKREKRLKQIPQEIAHKVVTKEKAKELGLPYYFTGKPCKYGHISDRYTCSSKCKECNRRDAQLNRVSNPEYMKEYRQKSKSRINHRNKTDPKAKAINSMRRMLKRVITLIGSEKSGRTVDLLGYSPDELIDRMESLFKEGMSWSNHGEWEIDHIIPVSVMVSRGMEDPAEINALSNLQPLWALDNKIKGAKIESPS